MKQGSASKSNNDGRKVEPKPVGINPGWVAQFGNQQGTHSTGKGETFESFEEAHRERGYKAPGIASQSHHSGSQGKHK